MIYILRRDLLFRVIQTDVFNYCKARAHVKGDVKNVSWSIDYISIVKYNFLQLEK